MKGLTFIPSGMMGIKHHEIQTRYDLQQYHRRIKLAAYFQDESDSNPPPFTPKSDWVPPEDKLPTELHTLFQTDLGYLKKHFRLSQNEPNLSQGEINALKELGENKQIVIKPADKGSAIVIWDREQYLWEGYRQLLDPKYYRKLDKPIYLDTIIMIRYILQSLHTKKFINAKQKAYLLGNGEPRSRRFYMLPKIHKDQSTWSKPFEIPPGRPIVSDCGSETYYTAEFLDFYLNPLSIRHPSYIKDTYDFVQKVKGLEIPENAILFTMDIDSLYTNIDTRDGIRAVKNIFQKYPDISRPDKELIQLLTINLNRNDFEFNGEFFLQIKGTAMGKKFAPAYANIFMAEWEASALARCSKQPLHYFRYLDDIWGIWTHSEEEFNQLVTTLNDHNPSIKLKSTTSRLSVDFLDTTTYKGTDFSSSHRLDIKVFFKETDTHALLHKKSFHPKHTYSGLVKSQLLRFHRICTQERDFKEATQILFRALRPRGYNRSFLRKIYKSYLLRNAQAEGPTIPFVLTYSSAAMNLTREVKSNFQNILGKTQRFKDHRVIAAFRKNKSLQDYLIRAKLRPLQETKPRHQGHYLKQTKYVQNKFTKEVFNTYQSGTVHSKNCVYLITCKQCGAQYVGETGNTILVRMTQHKHNIQKRKETNTYLVQHFLEHGWESFRVMILQASSHWSVLQRKRAEKIWIQKLGTMHPQGLNEK
ncbi:uncharacterized protein LOC105358296 isoform X1 [Tachysurus ichikawai]